MKLEDLLNVISESEQVVIRYYEDEEPIAVYDGRNSIPAVFNSLEIIEVFVDYSAHELNVIVEEE